MKTEHNLAGMLTDLANLHPSAGSIKRLETKYPGFLPTENPKITIYIMGSDKVPPDLPKELHYILLLRRMVRELWRGDLNPFCLGHLEQVLLSSTVGVGVLPSGAIRIGDPARPRSVNDPPPVPGIIGVDWKHRTFVYRPQTLLQKALHYFMQESPKAKICGNPDCPAPYFFASRSNVRYCSEDCLQVVQRAAKRAWWEEKGTDWRHKRKGRKAKI